MRNQTILQETGNKEFVMNDHYVHTPENRLSIRVFPDGFSLWITNAAHIVVCRKRVIYNHRQSINDFPELLLQQKELANKFSTTGFIIESDFYDIVPDILHNEYNQQNFLRFKFPELPDSIEILYKKISAFNCVLIYAIPAILHDFILKNFENSTINSHLESGLTKNFSQSECSIKIMIKKENADFLFFVGNHFRLANAYAFKNQDDILYHCLNILQLTGFRESQCDVTVYEDDAHTELSDKFRELSVKAQFTNLQLFYENYKRYF